MLSSPLDNKNGRTTLGVHAIIALRQYTESDDIGCGMLSWPLDRTYDQMTSGVTFHHRPWEAHTVG